MRGCFARVPSFALAVLLALALVVPNPVYADTATASDAVSGDDDSDLGLDGMDFGFGDDLEVDFSGKYPLFDDDGNQLPLLNAYNYGGPRLGLESRASIHNGNYSSSWFYNAVWVTASAPAKYKYIPLQLNVNRGIYDSGNGPEGYILHSVQVVCKRSVFPVNGSYSVNFSVSDAYSDLGAVQAILSVRYRLSFQSSNVNLAYGGETTIPTKYYTRGSNTFGAYGVPIVISDSPSELSFLIIFDRVNYPMTRVQLSGPSIDYSFQKASSDSLTSTNDNYSGPSGADLQESIADSVSRLPGALTEMSGQLENIGDTLRDIITTISNQLNALWNQMYNYMHIPLMAQIQDSTDQIVNAIEDINIDFSDFSEEIIANDNQLHQDQLANDDKNADQIMNGYDNSGMNSTNQKLGGSMSDYEEKEQELLGSVQGHIDDFEYQDPFAQFTAPLADFSFFLTGIYTGLGAFNIPIAFSLTLSIGLICIGWYRFRGG